MFAGLGTTDAKGTFIIEGLSPRLEPVWLVVRGLRGTAEAGPLKFGDKHLLEGIKMELQAPLEATGTVTDRTGKPVPGARVNLSEWTGKDNSMSFGGDDTLTDAKGRFAFRGMKMGRYSLQVRVRGLDVAGKTEPFDVGKKGPTDHKIKVASG